MMKYILSLCLIWPFLVQSQDATMNSSVLKYEIDSESKYMASRQYKLTIHNQNAQKYAVFHDYEDRFKRLTFFKLTIYDSKGNKVKKYGREDIIEYSFDANYHIDDTKSLSLKPEYSSYPYTIEVEMKWVSKGILGLPTWSPQSDFDIEIEQSSLEIKVAENLRLRKLDLNGLETTVDETKDGFHTYKWEVKELAAVSNDTDYQLFYEHQPKVHLALEKFEIDGFEGSTSSWVSFGQWIIDLNKARGGLLQETKDFLSTLDTLSKTKAISAVYQYMQNRTRYVSIQLGIGGWQTIPSAEVDETGFGDCKALTYYTMAMLDHMGIKSNGILVRAGRDVPDINIDFPSNQFNHIFLGVPLENDTIYLECTSQTQPFNYLGSFTDDRHVLWLEDGSSQIIKSPVYDQTVNSKETKGIVKLDKNGHAVVKLKSLNKGIFSDSHNNYSHLSGDQFEQYAQSNFDYKDFSISKYQIEPLDSKKPKYYSNYILDVNNLAQVASENIMIPSNVLNPITKFVKYSRYDEYAEIKRAFTVKEDVDIILPDGVFIEELPESVELETIYGKYELSFERKDEQINVLRKFTFSKGEYAEDDFDNFYRYIRRISRIEKKFIILNSKT